MAPPKCTSEHCFDCHRVLLVGKKKPKNTKGIQSSSSCSSSRPGEKGVGVGVGGVPAIFSLKCNELPAIFPPHFLLLHSNGASWISRRRRCRRRSTLPYECSLPSLSVYHERVPASPPHPPPLTPPRASCAPTLGACKGARERECFSFPRLGCSGSSYRISVLTGSAPAPLNLQPRPHMNNAGVGGAFCSVRRLYISS